MFVICNNGPYDAVGDANTSGAIVSLLYQPLAMRWRGATVLTNTPPRVRRVLPAACRESSSWRRFFPRRLANCGLDQVDIRRINCSRRQGACWARREMASAGIAPARF